MAIDLKSYVRSQIEGTRDKVLEDIAAISNEALLEGPGGAARAPYNFIYELVVINQRLAKRIRGEDPGPFDPNAWTTTPEEFQNRPVASSQFRDSMDEVLAALEAIPPDEMDREIVTPTGGKTNPFDLGMFCAYHACYHDGQLNYVQAIHGDAEIHWV